MRCPTCTTTVPTARFCNRCGAVLRPRTEVADGGPGRDGTSSRRRGRGAPPGAAFAAVLVLAALVAVTAAAAADLRSPRPGMAAPTNRVALPDAAAAAGDVAAAEPFVPSPSATVLCSDLQEHQVKLAWLDDPELGDAVELHGTPCIVTAIDAEQDEGGSAGGSPPRGDYPRGVARGNRPGTGPTPRP